MTDMGSAKNCVFNLQSLITLRTFATESEATVANSALHAFGIECVLSADDCGGQRPHLRGGTGIRLLIRSEDREEAEQVLASEPQPPRSASAG